MITGRNVLITVVAIAGLSLLSLTWSFASNSQYELGGNTYGVRAHGFRGLYETLNELKIPVKRELRPPVNSLEPETSLVFLGPDDRLVGLEPKYLQDIAKWIQDGGQLVYAPPQSRSYQLMEFDRESDTSFLETMGIEDVDFALVELTASESTEEEQSDDDESSPVDSFRELMKEPAASPIETVQVSAFGKLSGMAADVTSLAVPGDGLSVLQLGDSQPDGWVEIAIDDETSQTIAAEYSVGRGTLIIVSDPLLAQNRFLGRDDNSIFLVHLLARSRNLVFDEFYHGLTARGNPFVLLGRPVFTLIFALMIAAITLYAWRCGIRLGPPLDPYQTQRRSLGEYIEAMARLFLKSKFSTTFLIRECREGVLWVLHHELRLAPTRTTAADIYTALSRRDPQRAEQLQDCLRASYDLEAKNRQHDQETLAIIQRMTNCQ